MIYINPSPGTVDSPVYAVVPTHTEEEEEE